MLAGRTKTRVDDILVKHLKPMRIAWVAPLIALFLAAPLVPAWQHSMNKLRYILDNHGMG